LCQVGQTENQFGVCVPDGTVVTSQVNLSAFSPVTGGGYSSTPAPDRTLTVRKAQAFKVAWSQGNSALQDLSLSPANGYSCFTSVSKVGDSAWREPSSGTKWAAGSLLLEGNVAGLSLNQSGSYTYNATCEYGDHRNSSAAPPVTIIVAPSGAFEEF
jgi:hypothetical protein